MNLFICTYKITCQWNIFICMCMASRQQQTDWFAERYPWARQTLPRLIVLFIIMWETLYDCIVPLSEPTIINKTGTSKWCHQIICFNMHAEFWMCIFNKSLELFVNLPLFNESQEQISNRWCKTYYATNILNPKSQGLRSTSVRISALFITPL